MLPLRSSIISFRPSSWIFLLVLIYLLLLSGIPIEAQTTKENLAASDNAQEKLFESLNKNPWADIKGFRSAKFGMDEKSVFRAIAKDFKISKKKVTKTVHPTEKTVSLTIDVPELFKTGGTAMVGYIFGYKSKKLMHVNVVWASTAEIQNGQDIVTTANLLRQHFLKKRYKKEGLASNGQLSETSTLVFRGKDKKNKMITLLLSMVPEKENNTNKPININTQLILSYILSPNDADVRKIVIDEGDF